LPQNYRDMMEKARPLAYEALKQAQDAADKKSLEEWKNKGIVEIVYPPEELKKFAEVGAKPVWDAWIKAQTAKGVPAKELVDAVLDETEKAKKALHKM
jgi:TRAP-type C4-dicarboxylate transport system substrate-binding protein